MTQRFIRIDSPACTAMWEVAADAAPLWRYWGPRLADGVAPPAPLCSERIAPGFTLQQDQPLPLFAGPGQAWFGMPTLLAHRAGRSWSQAATRAHAGQPDPHSVVFTLDDDVAAIRVVITVRLDPASDVMSLATQLSNQGDEVLDVAWLAAGMVPLPQAAQQVHSFTGRHNSEFVAQSTPLGGSIWRRENRKGLSSHDQFPGAWVSCGDGLVHAAQLAWSGNHAQAIERCDDGRFCWQMGEYLLPGEVRLGPGQSMESPQMLATCSGEGADGIAWNFHRAIRGRISWPGGQMRPRPVHINSWEALYFAHDEADLMALADAAADIGVERFVLDDGWFAGRNNDLSSLGDWQVDRAKYPRGLGPLAAHVIERGMSFGLWVEPEMVSPDSDLYRAHPEWALQQSGRPLITARDQLVLNLTRSDVSEYLFACLAALLRDLPISYLKWDHNRNLAQAGETPLYREQVRAAYALLARLRQAFPDVEIEACAGGGGRIDAGIIRHTHRFWTSDCIDAVSRSHMQRGFLRFMPPEMMGSHVGASPAHSTGRMQRMDFRCAVALPGHFGVELDVRRLDPAERQTLSDAIARYKALRDRLHQGRVWQGDAGDGIIWQAHGDAEALLLLVTRLDPPQQPYPPAIRLPMLAADRRYSVTMANADAGAARTIDGGWLAAAGLALPPMPGESVLIYDLRAQ